MIKKHFAVLIGIILILSLVLTACGSSSSSNTPTGDAAAGQTAYASLACVGCHGENGEGSVGPQLTGYSKGWDKFHSTVRNGEEEMPKFGTSMVSDQQLADIYAWLTSTK